MQNIKSFILVLILVLGVSYVSAQGVWTDPECGPTGCNTPTPLNVSNIGQIKAGGLTLNTGGAVNGLIVDKGSVGIGTTTPARQLHVTSASNGNNPVARFEYTSGTGA